MTTTTTKPKGIIFRDWQVRALAEGRLTQVRVPVKSDGDWRRAEHHRRRARGGTRR